MAGNRSNPLPGGALLLAVTLAGAAGCRDKAQPHPAPSAGLTVSPPVEPPRRYAPGRWRLAPFEQVNRTHVWVAHVVVMHEASKPELNTLRGIGDWRPDVPVRRTRLAALERAIEVTRLVETGRRLGDLAAEYSDDVVTKDARGSLGGIAAGQLPGQYLDALMTMPPGSVSKVFETDVGFHLLERLPVPAAQIVSGKRLVVRYATTCCGKNDEKATRPREEALRLAEELQQQLQRNPQRFDALVASHSESIDVVDGGDMGNWSTLEPGFIPREVEQLAALQVGEVSTPLDSVRGFEILKRVALIPRDEYAMAVVKVEYDRTVPDAHAHSRRQALAEANRRARDLAVHPERFDASQTDPLAWKNGQGLPGAERVVSKLSIGQVAASPVESDDAYFFIPMRIRPSSVPAPGAVRYSLPDPACPNVTGIFEHNESRALADQLTRFSKSITEELRLAETETRAVSSSLLSLAARLEAEELDAKARVAAWNGLLQGVQSALSVQSYDAFSTYLCRYVANLTLWGSPAGRRGWPVPVYEDS